MIQKFTCTDGTVFVVPVGDKILVDEVIALLEPFRGKRFWNGATEDLAFRLEDDTIYCDSKLFQIECAYEKDGLIGKLLELFLASDDEYGTEEDWLERYEDAENHYTDYEYKYNGEEVN
jgi:hypothetical protein